MPIVLNSGDIRRLRQCLSLNTAFSFGSDNWSNNAISGDITAETAARVAADSAEAITRANADTALQNQITALQQPGYANNLMLGGM